MIRFELPFRVVGYQRAIVDADGAKRVTPKETRDAMRVIRRAALSQRASKISRGLFARFESAFFYPSHVRPDIDNAVKTVFDALKGIAWDDDKQVVVMKPTLVSGPRVSFPLLCVVVTPCTMSDAEHEARVFCERYGFAIPMRT